MLRSLRRSIGRRLEAYRRQRLFGDLAPLVPPTHDMFDGPGTLEEFHANGEEFLRIYLDFCGLEPDERMLDVGSGMGRKTIRLTRYLTGEYEGIDVNAKGVAWCSEHITPRFPNFRFSRVDVYNGLYNPTGTIAPSAFRFPFDDDSFTFVVLASVFTHMLPDDARHYLGEIRRVLAPGGRCLVSFFMTPGDSFETSDAALPERATSYGEDRVAGMYREAGLTITRIAHGSWSGREDFLSYQDLVLATKPASGRG